MIVGKGKDRTQVDAKFDAKKNQTTTDTHQPKQGKIAPERGLKRLRLATNKGLLSIQNSQGDPLP